MSDAIVRLLLFNLCLWPTIGFALFVLVPGGASMLFRALFAFTVLLGNALFAFRLRVTRPLMPRGGAWLIFLLCFIASLFLFASRMKANPHGMWDAWAAWSPKAEFLARNFLVGSPFTFQLPVNAHSGYPLALPVALGALGVLFGEWHPAIGQAAHTALFLTHWLLFYCVARRPLPAQPAWAGLCAALPALSAQAADQCADFPLSLALAGAVYLMMAAQSSRAPMPDLLVAGLCAGLLPNLKNEGMVAALALVGFALIQAWIGKWSLRRILTLFFPPAILWLAYLYLRAQLPAAPGFVGDVPALLKETGRYFAVIQYDILFLAVATLLLPVALLLRARSVLQSLPWFALWAIYSGFFVVTTYPQAWHLATAHFRLHLQLIPALFVTLLMLHPKKMPAEEARNRNEPQA